MSKLLRPLVLSLALLAGIQLSVAAVRITIGGVQYTVTSDNTVSASLTVKATGTVDIAEKVMIKGHNYKTTRITAAFFKKNNYLQRVTIPATVVQIDDGAFMGCANLTTVWVRNPDCEIEEGAFGGCVALQPLQKGEGAGGDVAAQGPLSQPAAEAAPKSKVDTEIPETGVTSDHTFAVIIGNEQYQQVSPVPHATNDARVFGQYCQKTLGLPEKNVRTYENASFGTMLMAVNDIKRIAQAYQGDIDVIFYYAGHGIPNETSRDAYLLPVDADGRQTEVCYAVSRLYQELSELNARQVVVFLDACFSGALRGDGMLMSARSVAIKPKSSVPQGNMVVFSAAQGDETAYPYDEQGHGLFTYYLLRKLQETSGKCQLGELEDYLRQNVSQQAVVINRKPQTPTVSSSAALTDKWRKLSLR